MYLVFEIFQVVNIFGVQQDVCSNLSNCGWSESETNRWPNRRSLEAFHESSTNRSQSALKSWVTTTASRILQANLLFRNKKVSLNLQKLHLICAQRDNFSFSYDYNSFDQHFYDSLTSELDFPEYQPWIVCCNLLEVHQSSSDSFTVRVKQSFSHMLNRKHKERARSVEMWMLF